MNEDNTKKSLSELEQRVANLEGQLAQKKADDLETPAEAEQSRFQATLESYNRDGKGHSLNSAPMTPEQKAKMEAFFKDDKKDE